MIRRAKFADIPRLYEIMCETHARSVYAGRCDVDERVAKSLIVQAVQRDGPAKMGATCLFVAEKAGQVEAFIIGTLDRVYHIGTKLMAQDMFFAASKPDPRDPAKLIDAYVAWAEGCPDVIEINISATTVVGPTARTEKLFQRKGFSQSGVIYERKVGE